MDEFDELIAEGDSVPLDGWDFTWFQGRATEERPPWGYSGLLAERMAKASAALDIQTGGGEVLAAVPIPPPVLAATEGWPPNAEVARQHLQPLGATVAEVPNDAPLPFPDASFDLVVSRHPTLTPWPEIARVLQPAGTFLSQQIGSGTNRELTEAMMGPQPVVEDQHRPEWAIGMAEQTGLEVVDLQVARLRVTFDDVGAVVHFLRKVLWTVPGFTVERYRDQLEAMHERIRAEGPFVSHSLRFLIEARKP